LSSFHFAVHIFPGHRSTPQLPAVSHLVTMYPHPYEPKSPKSFPRIRILKRSSIRRTFVTSLDRPSGCQVTWERGWVRQQGDIKLRAKTIDDLRYIHTTLLDFYNTKHVVRRKRFKFGRRFPNALPLRCWGVEVKTGKSADLGGQGGCFVKRSVGGYDRKVWGNFCV
jgi:hypothetical protein